MKTTAQFQNLPLRYWVKLDLLETKGWTPLINKLDNRWHVNLSHETAPVPLMLPTKDGDWKQANASPLSVHGHGLTLREALENAFNQVTDLTRKIA